MVIIIRDLDILANMINKSFGGIFAKKNQMIDNRQRRSVLIMMPEFSIMIYVGFASQPILSQRKIKWMAEIFKAMAFTLLFI